MNADADLFAQATRLQGLPAEPQPETSASPTPSPSLAAELDALDARLDAIREQTREESRALRRIVRESRLPMRVADRASLIHHLDHADAHGHPYSVRAALSVLRTVLREYAQAAALSGEGA